METLSIIHMTHSVGCYSKLYVLVVILFAFFCYSNSFKAALAKRSLLVSFNMRRAHHIVVLNQQYSSSMYIAEYVVIYQRTEKNARIMYLLNNTLIYK